MAQNQAQALPAILNVSTIPSIENMNIKTEVLDPITITQNQAVFQIPKTGILDGGSMIQLGVTAHPDNFFPIQTGIHGLIESVFLKVGGRVIASNTDYGYYTTMTRKFDTPEHRAYVDMIKSGACGDRFTEDDTTRVAPRDLVTTLNGGGAGTTMVVPTFIRPTQSDATTPLFSVPLSTLLPMMRSRQLPLLAVKEHFYLEVNFRQQADGQRGIITCRDQGSGASTLVTVSTPNIKFISDHLYYTNDRMDALLQQTMSQQGLSMLYEDLITTNANVPAGQAGASQVVERQIAVSGKNVRNIMVQDKDAGATHNFLGDYISTELHQPTSYNFRINDQMVYDRDVTQPSRKYNELSGVMGKPLMVPSQLYSFDADIDKATNALNQNSVTIGLINGHQLPNATNADVGNDIRGTSHYVGYDATTTGFNVLGNGASVGVKPIVLRKTYQRVANAAGPPQVRGQNNARELRIFTGVEKVMVIKNGEVVLSA